MQKKKFKFRILWHCGFHPEPVFAVCDSKAECLEIIRKRKKLWRDAAGYDITPQLQIQKFMPVEKEI